MTPPTSDRPWDVTLFGATGFVGRLIAAYLAQRAPASLRLRLAGRDSEKLARIAHELRRDVGVAVADVADPGALADLAGSTRVLLTTVGPYARFGEPVARACVEHGADYLDLTGEPAYVDDLVARHDAAARERGVLLLPCCGFDSIPTDLGVLYTVRQLPPGLPITIAGYVEGRGGFSGGTLASALGVLGAPRARRERAGGSARARPRLHFQPALARWGLPLPTIDPVIARRSAALRGDYGAEFQYGHYLALPGRVAVGLAVAGAAALAGLARLPPARALLGKLRPPGSGPSEATRARSWFKVSFVGRAGDVQVITEVSGGDPGYDETARMAGETALCLALQRDKLPRTAGVLTTAAAGGDVLLARLQAAGLTFRVRERSGPSEHAPADMP